MRRALTDADRAEIRSLRGQADDVLRCIVSVAGWFRVANATDGTPLYAPSPSAPGVPLDEAVAVIVAEARGLRAGARHGDEPNQEVADDQGETSGVHSLSVEQRAARVEVP